MKKMIEISHQTARSLLQSALDGSLAAVDQSALEAHLSKCAGCSQYADQLSRLESNLRSALHARWDRYSPSLHARSIQNPDRFRRFWSGSFGQNGAFGKVTIVVALLLGYFMIANVIGIRIPFLNDETPTAVPTPNESALALASSPTPSTQPTLLKLTSTRCKTTQYVVQENDTLESIAVRFGITKADIITYNPGDPSLSSNAVSTNTTLVIPLCEGTPIHTASQTAGAYTLTPMYGTVFPDTHQ